MSKLRIILELDHQPGEVTQEVAAQAWDFLLFEGEDAPPDGVLDYEQQIARAIQANPTALRQLRLELALRFMYRWASGELENLVYEVEGNVEDNTEQMLKTAMPTLPKAVREYVAHRFLLCEGTWPVVLDSSQVSLQRVIVEDEQGELLNVQPGPLE